MVAVQNDSAPVETSPLRAVVGVFEDSETARAAAELLRSHGLEFESVPLPFTTSTNKKTRQVLRHLSKVFYDPSDHITGSDVAAGATKGAAIGAAAGIVLVAVPGIGLAAVVGGVLGGAFIGGIAAIDEGDRSISLPTVVQYRKMLRNGEGLIIVYGDEATRIEAENQLKSAGASHTFQHPPVLHSVRTTH